MQQVIRVTSPANLGQVADMIHDRWFDVDDVEYDPLERCVRVLFPTDWVLEISEVESYELEETEGVGSYDFNRLVYSEADQSLTVSTGIPLVFRMGVRSLDVALSELGPA